LPNAPNLLTIGLFPAGAGVILGEDLKTLAAVAVPRRGGGDPTALACCVDGNRCSPQGRG